MAQTTWHPRTNFAEPRKWLLESGEVVSEPPLEQTASGRKVRIAGTDLSAYSRDMDTLILNSVEQVAKDKQTAIWMPVHNMRDALNRTAGFDPDHTPAVTHLLDTSQSDTTIWWRFKHPDLPIEALLFVQATQANRYYPQRGHTIQTALVTPRFGGGLDASAMRQNGRFSEVFKTYVEQEFLRDNPPSWPAPMMLVEGTCHSERALVQQLLDRIRSIEELDSIQIPDTRQENGGWLTLELHDSNMNSSVTTDLVDLLDGTPTVEEALRLYNEFRGCLSKLGIVLNELSESDLNRGLLGGEDSNVTVPVQVAGEGNRDDNRHRLSMHLPTGTFVVECLHQYDQNAVADRWEEALAVASLTGQEDTLLTFAREASRKGIEERTKKIMRERGAQK